MNPFRTLWYSFIASIKGMTYVEYLQSEKERLTKELQELPETNNFLSVLLEYYSFKSVKRSCEVLMCIFLVSLVIFISSKLYDFGFLVAIAGIWITQMLMFLVGIYLKYQYRG